MKLTTSAESISSRGSKKIVKVEAKALKGVPDIRVNLMSRARAMVTVGVINSVSSVTTGEIDRLTKVKSKSVKDSSRTTETVVYEIEVSV